MRIYDIEPLPLPYGSLYGLSLENARKTLKILSGSDEPPAKRQRTGQAKDPNNPKYN